MRVDLRNRLVSARPERGALVATLFAIVLVGLMASYRLSDVEGEEVALDTESNAQLAASPRSVDSTESPDTDTDTDTESAVGSGEVVAVEYQVPLDDFGDATYRPFDLSALIDEPEEEEAPLSPTTQAPATTAAPATVSETTAADEASTTSVEGDPATAATDGSETTVPAETTTAASAHPDGFVDAGHGVFVPPVLLSIRFCESTDNYQAANPSSSARGAYQFLRSSWAAYGHADRYGVSEAHLATNAQQDEAALLTWQRDGTRPWNASSSCWG